uniref:Uncharacterized protein n=1 Tax=Myotis myotis TaxID=51298 RepID=A0A7J7Z5R6_MYOMY|nr:hypothetical protein mMyoMyo1_010721 [Myotis myotis]
MHCSELNYSDKEVRHVPSLGFGQPLLRFQVALYHELHVSVPIQTLPPFGKWVSAWLRVCHCHPGWASTVGLDLLKHLKVLFECLGLGKPLKCVWPALSLLFQTPACFKGNLIHMFLIHLHLTHQNIVLCKTTGCPGLFRSSFNGTFLSFYFFLETGSHICAKR